MFLGTPPHHIHPPPLHQQYELGPHASIVEIPQVIHIHNDGWDYKPPFRQGK